MSYYYALKIIGIELAIIIFLAVVGIIIKLIQLNTQN